MDPSGIPRAFFDGASQQGICACVVFIIPAVGQKYEIYWNGGTGTNNKVEVMALAGLLSISDFLNLQGLKIYGDFKMIIDHVRSKHTIKNYNLSEWLERIMSIWVSRPDFSIEHINKGTNAVADALSKKGLFSQHGK